MRFFPILLLLSQSSPQLNICRFLPETDYEIPVTAKNQGITEIQYNSVIEQAENIYTPILEKSGHKLVINRLWEHPRVNAGTYRKDDSIIINMYGGFARHKDTTPDGFALVICHEIGHHIGGAPKKLKTQWSSVEGQADYFATLKCLRRVWKQDDNERIIASSLVPDLVSQKCSEAFSLKEERALCIRVTLAGMAIVRVSADIRREIVMGLATPDPSIVDETYEGHPRPQCRLDTYFQGAICPVDPLVKLSRSNERIGTCHEGNGDLSGLRPKCWHK